MMVDPRLERDLLALLKITHIIKPRKRLMRVRGRAAAWYLMGDPGQSWFVISIISQGHIIF